LQPGGHIGMFRIMHLGPQLAVLGEDDSHLDFRILLSVSPEAGGSRLQVETWVRPHHWGGWLYLALVLPVHWLLSKLMLHRMAQQLGESGPPGSCGDNDVFRLQEISRMPAITHFSQAVTPVADRPVRIDCWPGIRNVTPGPITKPPTRRSVVASGPARPVPGAFALPITSMNSSA
jgi:hypothetical protein